jgi:predicted transcriptional regulator
VREETDPVALTINVVSSYIGQNDIRPDDVPAFIISTYASIKSLEVSEDSRIEEVALPAHVPAVSVRKSLASPDHLISMIDGKPYKALGRHLAKHGLTPSQYRERYRLKGDYPMVSPSYSEVRKALALKIGLGRRPKEVAAPTAAAQPSKGSGRKTLRAFKKAAT